MKPEEFSDAFISRLKTLEELSDVEICAAGSGTPRNVPLDHPLIAVGVEKIQISQTAIDGDLGVLGSGWEAEIDVLLSVCVPESNEGGGNGCVELFAAVCGAFPADCGMGIRKMSAQKPSYDSLCGCFRMSGSITVSAYWTEEEKG